jgi:hypothetical protein
MPENLRQSISPTYDSRLSGLRYHVTTRIDDRTVEFRKPLGDPFVRHAIHLGWRDLLRGMLRRRLTVTVLVDGDSEIVNDVLELDDNTLVPNSSRRQEFNAWVGRAVTNRDVPHDESPSRGEG